MISHRRVVIVSITRVHLVIVVVACEKKKKKKNCQSAAQIIDILVVDNTGIAQKTQARSESTSAAAISQSAK